MALWLEDCREVACEKHLDKFELQLEYSLDELVVCRVQVVE